ncbi:Venom dipeptidyl peptidase 4 [Eumeta japonica]|uniref:Venom dipeptidyl peptidase 4 n=1 Tax=Eumeta variegata TaxID=151549 RepID=A0A4C1ZAX7_EUMVA|nr:Venom dipeptidyl peptidase 4 [Eumeta japonica]
MENRNPTSRNYESVVFHRSIRPILALWSSWSRYLRDSLHFIDARRVAVWGRAHGGFLAALALASSLDVFHCGVAIAPIVRWRHVLVHEFVSIYYALAGGVVTERGDERTKRKREKEKASAYAERYMGLPNATGNYRGYAEADVTKQAAALRDKTLLLVHGAADDVVHLQQSMALARALADQGAMFRQQAS